MRRAHGLPAERLDECMGTLVSQRAYGIGAADSCAHASLELARLQRLWSAFEPDSEVNRLGRNAGMAPITVATETAMLLACARALALSTGGAFDATVAPLVSLWHRAYDRGTPPSALELDAARALVDSSGIELGPGPSARLARPGQRLDLGGIGKGYAADRCCALYRARGLRHALIDLGGNVATLGGKPDGTPWRVGIQAPGQPRGRWLGYLELTDGCVVTSGNYERSFEVAGHHYGHIVDPRTGRPTDTEVASATIVASSAMLADALATACVVLGVERGLSLAVELRVQALLIDVNGSVHLTRALSSRYRSADDGATGAGNTPRSR